MSEFIHENDLARADGDVETLTDNITEITAIAAEVSAEIAPEISTEFSDAEISGAEISGAEVADDAAFTDAEPVAFTDLGLPEALVKKLAENGVHNTFPIQAAAIPDALAGRHVLGKANTGSGKTLAFGLAALANLQGRRARKGKPLALVLVPTRELAMQVSDALEPYGYAVGSDIAAVYGGAPMYKQVYALRRGVELLVATPGRLADLIEQQECDLSEVAIAILDEADQMADMGFMPIVSELLSQTDPAGQRMLFSATLDGAVDELVRQYLTVPVLHSVTPDDDEPTRMDHHLLVVEPNDKALITAEIAARHTPGADERRTILFARTKLGADRIAEKIREHGVSALALHGGMTQRARTKTLADFKEGRVPVLVATDVAARGIHVDGIDLVLHVDPAGDPKDYLHRAGRTARAGESGTVVTLVLPKQRKATQRLLEAAGVDAELTKVAPSSATLRELTGGRPVAEYVAEADAYHTARRAARDARTGEDGGRERGGFRRDSRDGRDSRGGFGDRDRGGFGGERRSFGDRDRGGYGDRSGSGFGGSRGGSGFGGSRGGSGFGDRAGSQREFSNRDRGGFGDRNGAPSGNRSGAGFGDRNRSGFGDRERSSYGDRNSAPSGSRERSSFGDRNGSQNRDFGNRDRSFGDRTGAPSGNRDRGGFGDRNGAPSGDRNRGGFGDRERSSYSDRNGAPSGDRNRGGFGGERGSYSDRSGSQNRDFGDRNRGS
ncbi:MAG: DEAD/DEAH box helicase, partial [Catenulispora sp.]